MQENFISRLDEVEDVVGEFLNKIQAEPGSLVLYGAGYCLGMFLDLFEESKIQIMAIADGNQEKWGDKIRGIKVDSWDHICLAIPNIQVVVTTSHYEEIEESLRKSGFQGKIWHLPINAYYKNSVYGACFIKKYGDRFQKAYERLADDISREVFLNIVSHNMSFDDQYFDAIKKYEIQGYFGTELFHNVEDEVIVDGGAFDGDTIREFFSAPDRKCRKIYAFEPDIHNFERLKASMKTDKVIPIHAGLGKEKTVMNFVMGNGVSSRIASDGAGKVWIDTIDNVLREEHLTFIKMDIEGAEADALMGGKTVISECMPTLAISAYHKMKDIFELMELIDKIGAGKYQFYLRHTFYYQKVRIQPDVIIYAKRKMG